MRRRNWGRSISQNPNEGHAPKISGRFCELYNHWSVDKEVPKLVMGGHINVKTFKMYI